MRLPTTEFFFPPEAIASPYPVLNSLPQDGSNQPYSFAQTASMLPIP
ncbi:hypothetical protein [Laspinema olomoucense]|nr:hypothetical protein [Laspinema sp. D3c]MCT7996685.1 hypothetical protein [Laspinema sp. D3c]